MSKVTVPAWLGSDESSLSGWQTVPSRYVFTWPFHWPADEESEHSGMPSSSSCKGTNPIGLGPHPDDLI